MSGLLIRTVIFGLTLNLLVGAGRGLGRASHRNCQAGH